MNRRLDRGGKGSAYLGSLVVLFVVLCSFGAVELLEPTSSEAGCTASEKAELARAGYKRAEIEQQCDDDDPPPRNPRRPSQTPRQNPAILCQTVWGTCRLNVLLQVGASCACYMPTGVFPGVAR